MAILTTVSTTRTENKVAEGVDQPQALVDGFSAAFWVAAAFAVVAIVLTLTVLRRQDLADPAAAHGAAM